MILEAGVLQTLEMQTELQISMKCRHEIVDCLSEGCGVIKHQSEDDSSDPA